MTPEQKKNVREQADAELLVTLILIGFVWGFAMLFSVLP